MSHHPISMYYRGRVEESWDGYDLKFFEATTPENNAKAFLNFGKKRGTIEFTETEKAVWYSHVEMWARVRGKTKGVIIIEHDAMLVRPIPVRLFENDMVCLGHTGVKRNALHGLAYYLTPSIATKMVADVKSIKKIEWNSDATIAGYCDKIGVLQKDHVKQIQNRSVGVTIEHRRK